MFCSYAGLSSHQCTCCIFRENASSWRTLLASDIDWTRIAVISGVGTRNYYRKIGYELEGPYMVKSLILWSKHPSTCNACNSDLCCEYRRPVQLRHKLLMSTCLKAWLHHLLIITMCNLTKRSWGIVPAAADILNNLEFNQSLFANKNLIGHHPWPIGRLQETQQFLQRKKSIVTLLTG